MLFPRIFWSTDNELFNLLKLMNSEGSPGFLSVRSSLLSETGWESSVLDHLTWLEIKPFLSVESGDGLLRGGNQIILSVLLIGLFSILVLLYFFLLVSTNNTNLGNNLVQLLIEIRELAGLSHDLLFHEEGWLDSIISSINEEFHSIRLECLAEEKSVIFHKISSSSSYLASSLWIISVDHIENLMMIATTWLLGNFSLRDFSPGLDNRVKIFIIVDVDGFVNQVSDSVQEFISLLKNNINLLLELLTLNI